MNSPLRPNADESLLHSQGYAQELHRGLSLWSSFSVGFATVSPVVGIYSVMSLGAMNAGPSWVWIVPLCLQLDWLIKSKRERQSKALTGFSLT